MCLFKIFYVFGPPSLAKKITGKISFPSIPPEWLSEPSSSCQHAGWVKMLQLQEKRLSQRSALQVLFLSSLAENENNLFHNHI